MSAHNLAWLFSSTVIGQTRTRGAFWEHWLAVSVLFRCENLLVLGGGLTWVINSQQLLRNFLDLWIIVRISGDGKSIRQLYPNMYAEITGMLND